MNNKIKKLKRFDWLLAAGVFLISFLLFLPSIWFDSNIFDDFFYIRFLRSNRLPEFIPFIMTPVLHLRSPLVQLSFYADRLLWGETLFPYAVHFSNVLYHAIGAVLLYFFCRKLRVKTAEKKYPRHILLNNLGRKLMDLQHKQAQKDEK